jgi:hypothetical protein
MNDLLIVGAYINCPEIEQIVYDGLVQISPHFDIALVAHTPASERIQKLVKYFIYDARNEIMYKDIGTVYWGNYENFYYEMHPTGTRGYHSFAMYRSLTNAVKLLSAEYDSFTYIEGDSLYSQEDIAKLKTFKTIANENNKQAYFVLYGNLLSTMFFYSKMDFVKKAFLMFKNSDEFLERCRAVGSYGDLENYLYMSAHHQNLLDEIHIIKGDGMPSMFPTSKIDLNRNNGKGSSEMTPYVFEIMKVENTNEIAVLYLNHSSESLVEHYPFYVDDEFIKNFPATHHMSTFKIYPKNNKFILTLGKNKFSFDKDHILSESSKSFIRYK